MPVLYGAQFRALRNSRRKNLRIMSLGIREFEDHLGFRCWTWQILEEEER